VQDNYVVQWGDASEKKALPDGLAVVPQSEYMRALTGELGHLLIPKSLGPDAYRTDSTSFGGWPLAFDKKSFWPVHCYAMVGVGRNAPPDTGTGAELYAVIGHAPRQLDRNIAIVGRVIEGIEYLSSLPRGTAALGFYATPEERVPIRSVRLGNDVAGLAGYQYLSTESASFARYADARANRRDAFFVRPAGGADVCNIPVPVRRVKDSP
jgi:peptidylprolyl isomerase